MQKLLSVSPTARGVIRRFPHYPKRASENLQILLRCFCTKVQKSIHDQVIEGLLDDDTVEDLLQEANLTLATTIAKCRSVKLQRRTDPTLLSKMPTP